MTGSSALNGSCGTNAIRRPRSARRSAGVRALKSSPQNSTRPWLSRKPSGSRPDTRRPIMLFPAPDSPTNPSTLPRARLSEIRRSTSTSPPASEAETLASPSDSTVSGAGMTQAWIEALAQAVAQDIERKDGYEDRGHGGDHSPHRLVHVAARIGDHHSPGHRARRNRQADEAEDCLHDDRDAHLQADEREDERRHRRQHLPSHRLEMTEPEQAGRAHVIATPRHDHLRAHDAAEPRP